MNSLDELAVIRRWSLRAFTVEVVALYEPDLDLSWDDTGETAKALDSGRFVAFCACARVLWNGHEVATDYLGNCIYESYGAFADGSSYFGDMVHNVIRDARKEVLKLRAVRVRENAA